MATENGAIAVDVGMDSEAADAANVKEECRRLQNYLDAGGRWPLLG